MIFSQILGINETMFFIIVVLFFILLLLIGLAIGLRRRQVRKTDSKAFDEDLFKSLLQAIGSDNIKQVSLTNERVSVVVKLPQSVDQAGLKALGLPVFIVGPKITILIKGQAKSVYRVLHQYQEKEE